MIEDDARWFAGALAACAETLGEPLSAVRIEGYFRGLYDLPRDVVELAFARVICEWRSGGGRPNFPRPADVRDLALRRIEDGAALAWEQATRALSEVGVYENVAFPDDPVIHHTISALGGWAPWGSLISRLSDREYSFERAHFLAVYRAVARRGGDAEAVPRLVGLIERENVARGVMAYANRVAVVQELFGISARVAPKALPHGATVA